MTNRPSDSLLLSLIIVLSLCFSVLFIYNENTLFPSTYKFTDFTPVITNTTMNLSYEADNLHVEDKNIIDTNYVTNDQLLKVFISAAIVLLATGICSAMLLRTLKNDVARYLQVDQLDQEEMACARSSTMMRSYDTIGISVGGAKDVQYRKCIEQNIMPSVDSITYNGLFYDYYFDTQTNYHIPDTENNTALFYPTYCYAKIRKLDFLHNFTKDYISRNWLSRIFNKQNNNNNNEFEHYISIGLNSNIKQNEFKRKRLNLVIVLDNSGSMSSSFDRHWYSDSKMKVANQSVIALLKHLNTNDRFGLITFNDETDVIQKLDFMQNIDKKQLQQKILNIYAGQGTNFEYGYNQAIHLYNQLYLNEITDSMYENRIIFITDAQINIGQTDGDKLLNLISNNALNKYKRIYSTVIGVGLDFDVKMTKKITSTRGCNYYTVNSMKEFINKMDDEFEYMVSPLVYNVCLKLISEGNSVEIDRVFGECGATNEMDIISNGEIVHINTLFPSKKCVEKGGSKGGIQLIKLKTNNDEEKDISVCFEVSFEDRNGKKYKNKQNVLLKCSKMLNYCNDIIGMDMKEDDDIMNLNYYDNNSIRKGILLIKYVDLIKKWIEIDGHYDSNFYNESIKVSGSVKDCFIKFLKYFEKEMNKIKDNNLNKEVKIMKKIINFV